MNKLLEKYKEQRKKVNRLRKCKSEKKHIEFLKERTKLFKLEREVYGWNQPDLWCLYATISEFILPRLKEFYDNTHYDDIPFKKMIESFELSIKHGRTGYNFTEEESMKVKEGLSLFSEYFFDFWY